MGRDPSRITMPAKAMREAGGRMARNGLRARTARAWVAKDAAQMAASAASRSGMSVGAGATWTSAVRLTADRDRTAARQVVAVGSPYHALFG
jgi:hypothetical protein